MDAYQAGLLQLDELIQRQNPLELELHEIQTRMANKPAPAPVQILLEAFTERIQHALAASDDETKQEVLRLLIERIVVSDEALTVEHIIPTVEVSRLHPTHHASRITHHASRITYHVSRITYHVSRSSASTAAFSSAYVSFRFCGISRTSASTGMKLVSPPQRGTTWVWT